MRRMVVGISFPAVHLLIFFIVHLTFYLFRISDFALLITGIQTGQTPKKPISLDNAIDALRRVY
jgi:hypothetical protein